MRLDRIGPAWLTKKVAEPGSMTIIRLGCGSVGNYEMKDRRVKSIRNVE
jgi:hypothetical protein